MDFTLSGTDDGGGQGRAPTCEWEGERQTDPEGQREIVKDGKSQRERQRVRVRDGEVEKERHVGKRRRGC